MQSLPQQTIYPPQATTEPHSTHTFYPTSLTLSTLGQHAPNQPSHPTIKGKTTGPSPESITSSHPLLSSLLYRSLHTVWALTQTTVHSYFQMGEEILTNPPSGASMLVF